MDTKVKKQRIIVSFVSFFLGVSFLLTSGAALLRQSIVAGWSGDGWARLRETDYQNTMDFREYVQNRLFIFLVMATGGEISGYYGPDGYYRNTYDDVFYGTGTDTVTEDFFLEAGATTGELYETEQQAATEASKKKTKKENEADAKAYHEAIRENKNLRYRIVCDGKEKFSNMDDLVWDKERASLPDGYNFYLFFDGEKVTIMKDGTEVDVYGDGYFRDNSQWYVPGYQNFVVDTDLEKVEITILAAKEPVYYSYVKYGEEGYIRTESRLFSIAEDLRQGRDELCRGVTGIFFGIVFLAVCFFLRREKKEADFMIGLFTGKIWMEAKIPVFLFFLAGLRRILRNAFLMDVATAYSFGSVWEETAWAEMGYSVSEVWYTLCDYAAEHPVFLLACFWTAWLVFNDIRKNRSRFFHGLFTRLVQTVRTAELKQPFSVQAVHRFLLIVSVSFLFVVLFFALCISAGEGITNDVETILTGLFLFAVFLGVCYHCLYRTRRQAAELDILADYLTAVHNGDYSEKDGLPEDSALKPLYDQIAGIGQGMEKAVGEQLRSERMKVELVANVSHDIRTPLTSIISYVQFLKQEEGLPEHVRDYIHILDEKSERLNNMVQDVFAVSKAASGQLPVELKELDFGKLLRQTLADMTEQIQKSAVTVKAEIPEYAVHIVADGGRMYRVFQNLILNALKYSLDGSRVFVTLREEEGEAVACVKNTSRQELYAVSGFTERFVRGDESRTDGGTGLGLSIAKSFTEACGGIFALETNADLFVVTVRFSKR